SDRLSGVHKGTSRTEGNQPGSPTFAWRSALPKRHKMKRYLLVIAGFALLGPQLASAQPGYDSGYGRRGGYYDYRPYAPGYARDYRDCQRETSNRQGTNAAIGA